MKNHLSKVHRANALNEINKRCLVARAHISVKMDINNARKFLRKPVCCINLIIRMVSIFPKKIKQDWLKGLFSSIGKRVKTLTSIKVYKNIDMVRKIMSFTVVPYFTFKKFERNDKKCYLCSVLQVNHIDTILFTSNHLLFN